MDLTPRLRLIHEPTRLRIMTLLFRRRDIDYTSTRDLLGLTDGNLAGHVRRLEEAGLVRARRVLATDGFELRYTITEAGSAAFAEYLAELVRFAREAQGI